MAQLTLEALFAELDRSTGPVPLDVLCDRLRRLDLEGDVLRAHIAFGDDGYRRNLVHLGPGYVALVLCWRAGQASPVHDHRGSACALRVIRGVASERRYRREPTGRLVELASSNYAEGQVCGTYDADIHTMFNADPAGRDLVTLHVYTPPMRRYFAYSLDDDRVVECADREVLEEERRRAATPVGAGAAGGTWIHASSD
jgi:cysteine dioxygenase